jgi:hypothetical protein
MADAINALFEAKCFFQGIETSLNNIPNCIQTFGIHNANQIALEEIKQQCELYKNLFEKL